MGTNAKYDDFIFHPQFFFNSWKDVFFRLPNLCHTLIWWLLCDYQRASFYDPIDHLKSEFNHQVSTLTSELTVSRSHLYITDPYYSLKKLILMAHCRGSKESGTHLLSLGFALGQKHQIFCCHYVVNLISTMLISCFKTPLPWAHSCMVQFAC